MLILKKAVKKTEKKLKKFKTPTVKLKSTR